MENRTTTKKVEIKGRQFVLEKFDPFFGVYLATIFIGEIAGKNKGMESLIRALMSKPKNEFIQLQKDILQYCYEILPVGRVQVVNEEGNFAIQDVSSALTISLLIQSLMFSMTDFFDQEVMKSLMSEVSQTFQSLEKSLPQKN